ncbi:MAG: GNAT family N-acetyltransferase [Bacteroidales bacterium]
MVDTRLAHFNDIEQIRLIYKDTIQQSNKYDYTAEQLEAWIKRGDNLEEWENRIQDQYFVVAFENDKVIGFASLRTDGYLSNVFVLPEYQSKGIGRLLYEKIEKHAKRMDMFQIISAVSVTAKPFFEKLGFDLVKKQTVNIGIEVTNYLMQKNV